MSVSETIKQQCATLRTDIDTLIQQPAYDVEQVADLVEQLNQHLCQSVPPQDNIESFAQFLQQNLDWLQATMAKLSADKEAVADNMLEIKKGQRARHSYGQHN
ncbi:MAG: hypothetical protein CVV11_19615 [Gammaproteobacteria bacterium HGW-Gammaproteobacteria-15]|nr:MAG: hypothetical protein CVV11_19615 [Gammaproteobacteria bacterium HGW-Gammaproteobacteria-15]